MAGRLAGKHALVTGAASGIGREIACRFVAEGASVAIADIDDTSGVELARALGSAARFAYLDVTSEAQWSEVIAASGRIDILVNNAGITTLGNIEDTTPDQFRHELDVDVMGVFLGCKLVIPSMVRQGGSIINMASMTSVRADGKLLAYSVAKAAVAHMTKACALHFAAKGYPIRCNSIHPGGIRTPLVDKTLAQSDDPEGLMGVWLAQHPIGRLGTPEEIAAVAVYLGSDESTFTTGAEFRIDGGATL